MASRIAPTTPLLALCVFLLAPAGALADAPFGLELTILSLDGANNVALGDLDLANGPDVFTASESTGGLAVATQDGDGTWTVESLTPGSSSRDVELADLDGDGDLDLVYTDFQGDRLYWRANDLDISGTFLARVELANVGKAQGAFAVDVDGDDDVDVLLAGRTADAYFWIENTAGDASSWTTRTIQSGINAAQVVWGGDVDGDGDVDVVGGSASGSGKLAWYENTLGDGTAWMQHDVVSGIYNAVTGADIDHDGDVDLVVQDSSVLEIRWWENTLGDGSAWTGRTLATFDNAGKGLRAVDVDLDGDLDLVGARAATWFENAAGDASVWTPRALAAGPAADLADSDAVDLDGDGDPDIVAARVEVDVVSWWPNLTCSPGDPDTDADGVLGACDVCDGFDDRADEDADGVPDGCDACPGADDRIDLDGNGVPDACQGVRIGDVTVLEGDAGITELSFPLAVGGDPGPFTLDLALRDGTATVGDDVLQTTASIGFDGFDGEEKTFVVLAFPDTVVEEDETFFVDLSLASGAVALADPEGLGTVENDDTATVSLGAVELEEGDAGTTDFTFTVLLTGDVQGGLDIDWSTSGVSATEDDDYVGQSDTLSFVGTSGETRTLTVLVNGDTTGENDETFQVVLDPDHDGVSAEGPGLGTILDDDIPRLRVSADPVDEGDGGSTDLVFTIVLSTDTDPFEVDVETVEDTASDTDDFEGITDTLSFSGTAGETETVAVTVHGDSVVEGDERFSLSLAPSEVAVLAENGVGWILDDDTASVGIDDVEVDEGDGGTVQLAFSVSLLGDTQVSFDVDWETFDATATTAAGDYTGATGSVSLGDGSFDDLVTVVAHGDSLVEGNETFTVELSGELPAGVTFADASAVGTIANDDSATVAVADVTALEADAATGGLTFTVTLTGNVQDTFSVDVQTADGTASGGGDDYGSLVGAVSLGGGSGSTDTVTVTVHDDDIVEGDETFTVDLSADLPVGVTFADDSATGTVQNDDSATVALSDASGSEGDAGTTDLTFTVTLNGNVQDAFDVGYGTADDTATAPADYTAATGTVSLGSGTSSDTVVVAVQGDTLVEGDETFLVGLTGPLPSGITFTDDSGQGLVLDDDAALTVAVEGTGNVGSSPAGIDCGDGETACEAVFPVGSVVDLTASPADGWVFGGWSGDADCDDGSVTLTVSSSCTATFVPDQGTVEITFSGTGSGHVSSDPVGLDCDRDGSPSDCEAAFATGSDVTLGVSVTGPGTTFGGFEGDPDCEDGMVTILAAGTTIHCIAIFDETPLFADGFESGDLSGWEAPAR